MAITKRTLNKWRKEALVVINNNTLKGHIVITDGPVKEVIDYAENVVIADRILQMTQELLDQELLKEADKDEG